MTLARSSAIRYIYIVTHPSEGYHRNWTVSARSGGIPLVHGLSGPGRGGAGEDISVRGSEKRSPQMSAALEEGYFKCSMVCSEEPDQLEI